MTHQRTLIRTAIRDLLINATSAGVRVYKTRSPELRNIELPAIVVWSLDEAVDDGSKNTAPRELTRDVDIVIEAWAVESVGVDLDDAMDALALEIEDLMHADPYLGDTAAESILTSTDLEVIENGKRLIGLVSLTYAVTYRTLAPVAPVSLFDLNTVDATHNLVGNVQDGTGDTLTRSVDTMTLDDSDAAFDAAWIGQDVWLAGATSVANNGRFVITAVPSATTIEFVNAVGVAEAFPGTWQILSSEVARDQITVQA